MPRENKRRSVAGSVRSGRSSLSSLTLTTQLGSSYSSNVSSITMDESISLGSGNDRSSISYRNFGPKLRTMPEAQRASDPDMEEVQEYLDNLRLASHHNTNMMSNNNNKNNHRFSICCDGDDALCNIPRRKSSSSQLDYKTAHQSQTLNNYFLRDNTFDDSRSTGLNNNPLQGDIDYSMDSFCAPGLEEDDEVLPLAYTPRSKASQRSSNVARGVGYYGTGISSISLDMDDIFGEEEEEEEERKEENQKAHVSRGVPVPPPADVSPKMAKRRSSLTVASSTLNDSNVRIIAGNLADSRLSLGDCKIFPEDSGEFCLAEVDDRFETRCPKEKSTSIAQPTRRVSAYTPLDMRAIKQLTTCRQG